MIKINNLSKTFVQNFKKIQAVRGLNLNIKKGEVFGFLGPNGAGKTTTVKLLLGLLKPTKGTIFIKGKSPSDSDSKKVIGFLPEQPVFYKYLTGKEFLRFSGELFGLSGDVLETRVRQLLCLVNLVSAQNLSLRKYSRGMLQRVGIAQSLINDPEILLWDEPMSGLDPLGRREVKQIMLDLNAQGKTIFFNTHILNDVEELCSHIGILHKGRLLKYGTIRQLTKGKNLEEYFISVIKKDSRG